MNKCPYYNDGNCDVTKCLCTDAILCTPETVYLDTEDYNKNETQNR